MRLADRKNLEGNLSRRHALSASSARSASRLSPSRLSGSLALSENSLTRAKSENGAKRDVEVSKPFLSLEYQRERER